MSDRDIRRYKISEVSEATGVSIDTLRRWDTRDRYLRPRRDRVGRRYYTAEDIEIVRRVKQLLEHDGLKPEGVRKRLALELRGEGKPKTQREAIERLNEIEGEIEALLDRLENN